MLSLPRTHLSNSPLWVAWQSTVPQHDLGMSAFGHFTSQYCLHDEMDFCYDYDHMRRRIFRSSL